jgi:hypothetical protein
MCYIYNNETEQQTKTEEDQMKTVTMRVVKTNGFTKQDGSYVIDTSYITDVNDKSYLDGWHLPAHAKKIISDTVESVDILEQGDRVMCEVHRGSAQSDDGIVSGGSWRTKTGVVESVTYDHLAFIKFDDGDYQSMNPIRGSYGYPGKNIQPISLEV